MFYVYGTDGRQFVGTLENLLPGRKVESVGKVGPLHNESLIPEEGEAVAAYRKSIQLKKQIGPLLHAHQIMTSPVVSVDRDSSLDSAWKVLRRRHIHHLPVTAAPAQRLPYLAGMITENDFYRSSSMPPAQNDREVTPVSGFMKTPVYSADRLTDIRRIAQLMFEKHIGCMPVVGGDGSLEGIVTRSDILRALVNHPSFDLWA